MRSRTACTMLFVSLFALPLMLAGSAHAQTHGPFAHMAGSWNGAGMLEMSDGKREKIKCHASYDVPTDKSVDLSIRCASESYNFEIRSSVVHSGGAVSGSWSESATLSGGDLAGHVSGGHISAIAKSANFTASLNLTTNGNHQSVSIRSRDPKSSIKGVTISLRRGSV
jgi:hypothetical protein